MCCRLSQSYTCMKHAKVAVDLENQQQYQIGRQPLPVSLTITGIDNDRIFSIDSIFYTETDRSTAQVGESVLPPLPPPPPPPPT